jgi:hypothetical protein
MITSTERKGRVRGNNGVSPSSLPPDGDAHRTAYRNLHRSMLITATPLHSGLLAFPVTDSSGTFLFVGPFINFQLTGGDSMASNRRKLLMLFSMDFRRHRQVFLGTCPWSRAKPWSKKPNCLFWHKSDLKTATLITSSLFNNGLEITIRQRTKGSPHCNVRQ